MKWRQKNLCRTLLLLTSEKQCGQRLPKKSEPHQIYYYSGWQCASSFHSGCILYSEITNVSVILSDQFHLRQLGVCLPSQSLVRSVWCYWCPACDLFLLQKSTESDLYKSYRENTQHEYTPKHITWNDVRKYNTYNEPKHKPINWITGYLLLHLVMMARCGGAMQAPMNRTTFSCRVCL